MEAIFKNGLVLQPDFSFKKQDLIIGDGVIKSPKAKTTGYDEVDAKNKLIMPSFTNAHVHMAMGLAKGMGAGMPLEKMFKEVLFPLEEELTDKQAYIGALVCASEFIMSGCTHVHNIGRSWSQPVLEALDDVGLKGSMALALKDVDLESKEKVKPKFITENKKLVKNLKKHPRIKGMFGLANEVESSGELILRVKGLAKKYGVGIHMHVAESSFEENYILKETDKTSVEYLNSLGILNEKTRVVHAVDIAKTDIKILAESESKVVHCPTANLMLRNGISPVGELLKGGVNMRLGVDDPVATSNNDILRELFNMAVLQESRGFHLKAEQLLPLLIGEKSLAPDTPADIVLIDIDKLVAGGNFLDQLVFGGLTVDSVLVDGNALMWRGELLALDYPDLLEKASDESAKLFN